MRRFNFLRHLVPACALSLALAVGAAIPPECPALYGIHDHQPDPAAYLSRVTPAAGCGWVTATVAVGHNPTDRSGVDFSALAEGGHTVICRINNGYFPDGTIPLPAEYDNFANRCSNFVANSSGCRIWVIGNECNIAGEWPFNGSRFAYVTPQTYAACFRKVYNAIKAVRPQDKILPQALAPWSGPYGGGTLNGYPHDALPINWVQYLNQMLSAIESSGPLDGIALHINSRGYSYANIHSASKVTANGQALYFSFYVYKDWVELGIPKSLYHLPLYATECNGYYFWKGGHAEDPSKHYEAGWMQEIYAEIDRYNQFAAASGRPVFRCVNMYRWCDGCDGWNIDGASNPYRAQILSDLDAAVAQNYRWPDETTVRGTLISTGAVWRLSDNGSDQGTAWRGIAFNDAGWAPGSAQLGYGDGDEATVVGFGPNANNKYVTTYFRRAFHVPDPAFFTNLTVRLLRDDGAVVYLNGVEIFRSNMPAGTITYSTLAAGTATGADESSNFHSMPVNPALLQPGTNVVAVEVHQVVGDSSDISFDLELRGEGNRRPRVRIASPVDRATVPAAPQLPIDVDANDDDGTVARVAFVINGVQVGEDLNPPFTFNWVNPREGSYSVFAVASDSGGAMATSAPVRLTVSTGLVFAGSRWTYLDDGSNQGTAWRGLNFNDGNWSEGGAQLGYGDGDEATVIGFGPDSNNKYLTTYFRQRFVVSDPAVFTNLLLRLRRDDGAVVYLNGTEILRSNLPGSGAILYNTTALNAVGGSEEDTFFGAVIDPALLAPGTNIVAVEVHQANGGSSDLSFDLELLGLPQIGLPTLGIEQAGTSVRISWPLSAEGFLLQGADSPANGVWIDLGHPVIFSNGQKNVTVTSGGPQRYFRLRQ